MATLGLIISAIGSLVFIAGAVMILFAAFHEHILWGLAVIFIAPAALVFIVLHWPESKKGTIYCLAATAIVLIGSVLRGTA